MEHHGFSDGGKNPRFAPVKFNMKSDGGKKAGFCTRESAVVSEMGGFAHMGWDVHDNCRL